MKSSAATQPAIPVLTLPGPLLGWRWFGEPVTIIRLMSIGGRFLFTVLTMRLTAFRRSTIRTPALTLWAATRTVRRDALRGIIRRPAHTVVSTRNNIPTAEEPVPGAIIPARTRHGLPCKGAATTHNGGRQQSLEATKRFKQVMW